MKLTVSPTFNVTVALLPDTSPLRTYAPEASFTTPMARVSGEAEDNPDI